MLSEDDSDATGVTSQRSVAVTFSSANERRTNGERTANERRTNGERTANERRVAVELKTRVLPDSSPMPAADDFLQNMGKLRSSWLRQCLVTALGPTIRPHMRAPQNPNDGKTLFYGHFGFHHLRP